MDRGVRRQVSGIWDHGDFSVGRKPAARGSWPRTIWQANVGLVPGTMMGGRWGIIVEGPGLSISLIVGHKLNALSCRTKHLIVRL